MGRRSCCLYQRESPDSGTAGRAQNIYGIHSRIRRSIFIARVGGVHNEDAAKWFRHKLGQ